MSRSSHLVLSWSDSLNHFPQPPVPFKVSKSVKTLFNEEYRPLWEASYFGEPPCPGKKLIQESCTFD